MQPVKFVTDRLYANMTIGSPLVNFVMDLLYVNIIQNEVIVVYVEAVVFVNITGTSIHVNSAVVMVFVFMERCGHCVQIVVGGACVCIINQLLIVKIVVALGFVCMDASKHNVLNVMVPKYVFIKNENNTV